MKTRILTVIAALATMLATVVASSACAFFSYQPDEPQCLRER